VAKGGSVERATGGAHRQGVAGKELGSNTRGFLPASAIAGKKDLKRWAERSATLSSLFIEIKDSEKARLHEKEGTNRFSNLWSAIAGGDEDDRRFALFLFHRGSNCIQRMTPSAVIPLEEPKDSLGENSPQSRRGGGVGMVILLRIQRKRGLASEPKTREGRGEEIHGKRCLG